MKLGTIGALFTLLASAGAAPQDEPPDINFQFKVDQAIEKGVKFLHGKRVGPRNGNELIVLTYVHSGIVPDTHPHFQALFKEMIDGPLEHTYRVALQAMVLEEYERVKFQWRIHQCAQFLADNISPNGLTRYGQPTAFVEQVPVPTGAPRDVATGGSTPGAPPAPGFGQKVSGGDPGERKKPPVAKTINVSQKRPGPGDHDHSNMQYSALGLRACHDAGIRFEPQLLKKVEEAWRAAQHDGDGKPEPIRVDPPRDPNRRPGAGASRTMVTYTVEPQGWSYQKAANASGDYGSMTAGAIGALCILDYIQGKDWRRDQDVLEGLQWLNKNFSVTANPKGNARWHYYYLYGLERAGMLFGTEHIGDHKWYRTGAEYLLQNQAGDGGWKGDPVDTCFAILFLRRATRRLPVATGGNR